MINFKRDYADKDLKKYKYNCKKDTGGDYFALVLLSLFWGAIVVHILRAI